jgi:VanZ family protein
MAVIFHLSAEPNPLPTVTEHVWDKILHFVEYGGLAFVICRAFAGEGLGWLTAIVVAALVASLYGASDEWHQAFVPNRSSDVHDWMADSIGALAGAAAFIMFSTALRRRHRRPR